jgi:hypothetical protein
VSEVRQLAHRGDRADDVGHRRDRHEPDAVEEPVDVGQVEPAVLRQRDPADLDAPLERQLLPGHDVGVVLELGQQDGVPLTQVGRAPRAGDQVDRLGGVLGEDDLVRVGCADERRGRLDRADSIALVASSASVYAAR